MGLLARLVVRRPRATIAGWLLVAAASAVVASGLLGRLSDRGFAVPGSESARAAALMIRHLPGHRGAELLAVVTVRDPDQGGAWIAAAGRRAERALGARADVRSLATRGSAVHYGRGDSATTLGIALVEVLLRVDPAATQSHVSALRHALARADGGRFHALLLGPPVLEQRYASIARADLTRAERLALPLTALVLLVAFQAVVAALLPVLLAVVSMLVAFACLAVVGEWVGISVFVTNTATILALGLSVDFSLFIVTRFREELARGGSTEQALIATLTTTGRAVLLSACTIAASLVGLLVVGIATFSTMAVGAGIATLAAAATALTLLPATIRLAGPRIEWLRIDRVARAAARATLWSRLARAVTGRPVAALLGSLALLLALALPATSFRLDVHTQQVLPREDPVRREMAFVSRMLYPGAGAPILITTHDQLARVKDVVQHEPGVAQVWHELSGSGGWSTIEAILRTPSDGRASRLVVQRLRRALARRTRETYVGGTIAGSVDLVDRIASRAPWAILTATALCFVLLAWGLRSLVIPLKAVLTTLLSVGATLGLLLRLFDGGAATPHLEFFVPLSLFAIVFGLSVDYEVFLLSRIREAAAAGHDHREAVRRGLVGSGRSITLAGLTLTTVFLAFASSRLLPLQQLGVGLALAVAIDVTLVRCVLVPATVVLLRQWNWWWPFDRRRALNAPARGPAPAERS
ncbi:MAG: MMPL family transporter [Actinobacteria bacterium]|nr:MMPL family transporter [Actinomycetota bacterium]